MDGHGQALCQLLLGLILRQVQLVEARVGARQPVAGTIRLVDLEALGPTDTLQGLEATQRDLAGACTNNSTAQLLVRKECQALSSHTD